MSDNWEYRWAVQWDDDRHEVHIRKYEYDPYEGANQSKCPQGYIGQYETPAHAMEYFYGNPDQQAFDRRWRETGEYTCPRCKHHYSTGLNYYFWMERSIQEMCHECWAECANFAVYIDLGMIDKMVQVCETYHEAFYTAQLVSLTNPDYQFTIKSPKYFMRPEIAALNGKTFTISSEVEQSVDVKLTRKEDK